MTIGDVRCSQLTKKQGENATSQRPTKQPREDLEETTPLIATITEESVNRNQNFVTAFPITTHNTDGLALKLNCLKEISAWYLSLKVSTLQCIKSKLVPKGLELKLEPQLEAIIKTS